MIFLNWHEFFPKYWELVNKNELMALGGQVAYYMILSFFPLLAFFLTLAGYANLDSEQIFEDVRYLLPEETYHLIEGIIYETFSKQSLTLLSFGMLGTLWASLNGINALMRGIVKAYGLNEKRTFLNLKLTAVLFLLIITVTVFIFFIILLFGEKIGTSLFEVLGAASFFPLLWHKLKLIIQFVLLILTFIILNLMATHSIYEPRIVSSRMVLPGSLFAATGWVVISLAFTYYFKHFTNFSLIYGSIGGVMIFLLWLYWSCEILLLGCALNAVLIGSKYNDQDFLEQ